jgi:aarF domain-containing kinase
MQRNLRTVYNSLVVAIDYKLNFVPGKSDSIDGLHDRVSKRILDVCKQNGGLYIKFGMLYSCIGDEAGKWN